MTIRVTPKTARLLRVLLDLDAGRVALGPSFHMSSAVMMRQARITSGSFYPLIARLEEQGWIEGEWEVVPEGVNRPRRRFYHLTEQGVIAARSAVKDDAANISLWRKITKGLRRGTK